MVKRAAGVGGLDEPVGGAKGAGAAPESAITRRVIYNATVEVAVKDVDDVRAEVSRLVDLYKGYIAKSDVSGQTGTMRTARWTLKVPAEHFHLVIDSLAKLGTMVRNSSDSQDVTEEFVDLQARIKNLRVEEETLNKFLKETVTNVDGYLKTREQIKTVRGDIERAEGRLKYLATMTAMSTIEFTAREDVPYTPDTPASAPTFGGRLSSTLDTSWSEFLSFCEAVVLFVVALLPWTPLLLVAFLLLRWGVRWVAASNRRAEDQRQALLAEKEARRRERESERRDAESADAVLVAQPVKEATVDEVSSTEPRGEPRSEPGD